MILVIDNYDSFTYNLVDLVRQYHKPVQVIKNDSLSLQEIIALKPQAILISPGPSTPLESGVCLEVIEYFHKRVPILGICLGHQVLAHAFGGHVVQASQIHHGKEDQIYLEEDPLFKDLPSPLRAIRYHSLHVEKSSLPACLLPLASSHKDQVVMALKHKAYPLYGLQFHPESYGSEGGHQIIKNFIKIIKEASCSTTTHT